MNEENYAAEKEIVVQGELCDSIFFIVEGQIEVRLEDADGKSHLIEILG